jgi:hypothetical protein
VLRSEIDCRGGTDPARPARSPSVRWYTGVRRDLVGAVVGAALVGAAFLVPHLHDAAIAPVVNPARWGYYDFADAAPLFGWRNVHTGWGTPCAVAIAAAVVLWGPRLAHRLAWRPLLAVTWVIALVWAVALAGVCCSPAPRTSSTSSAASSSGSASHPRRSWVVDDQQFASRYTVLAWTVVITLLRAPGTPESVRE